MAAARPKGAIQNQGNPVGDFAKFLCAKLESDFRKSQSEDTQAVRARFVKALNKAGIKARDEAVRKWERGRSAPKVKELGLVAKVLGYRDWFDLVQAIRESKAQ